MRCTLTILAVAIACCASAAHGQLQSDIDLDELNAKLAGRIVDHTHNHGQDNRIYSNILCQPRDLYVYLPPCYHATRQYPLVVWFHGAFGDEHAFLDTAQIEYLDRQIRCGCLPPMIVIGPDGSCKGENRLLAKHSFFINGCCGHFEDHIMQEVLPLVMSCYSIRQDKAGHALVGVSAGGMGAMALAIKHRDFFGSVATLAGVINLRYYNVQEDYFADFDPSTYRWRTEYYPREVIGIYAKGLIKIRARLYIEPVWGTDPGVVARIARDNPADLLFTQNVQPGELNMLVAFGGRDNLNLDAEGRSFAWLARCCRGLDVDVRYYPEADHGLDFFRTSQRMAYGWLASKVEPPAADEPTLYPSREALEPPPWSAEHLGQKGPLTISN